MSTQHNSGSIARSTFLGNLLANATLCNGKISHIFLQEVFLEAKSKSHKICVPLNLLNIKIKHLESKCTVIILYYAPGVGTQEKWGQGISGGRSLKDERRETGRNWKTIEKTQRDSKEYGEVGNRRTWNGKQELQNSGYLYTGPDRNRSEPNRTGPDWLQFTRDHSGNSPERIQNWTYRKGGLVLDPFRAGS